MSEKNIYLADGFLKIHSFQLLSIVIFLIKGFFFRILSPLFLLVINLRKLTIYLITVFIILPIDFFFFIYLFFNDKNNVLFSKELSHIYFKKKNFFQIYIRIRSTNIIPSRILTLLYYSDYKKKNFLKLFQYYSFFQLLIFFLKRETFFFSNKDSLKWKFNFFNKKKFGFYKNNTEIKDFISKREISFKEMNRKLETNGNLQQNLIKKFLINLSHLNINFFQHSYQFKNKKIFYNNNFFKDKINSITLNKIKYKPMLTKYYKIKKFLYKNVRFKIDDDFFISNNFFIGHEKVISKYLNYYGLLKKYFCKKFGYRIYRFDTNKNEILNYNVRENNFHNKTVIFSTSKSWNNYFHYIFEIIIPNYYYFIKYKKKIDVVMNFPFYNLKKDIRQIFQNKIIRTNPYSMNSYKTGICGNFINKLDNYFPSLSSSNDVIFNQLYINKKAVNILSEKVINCSKDIKINKNIIKKTAFITRSSSFRNLLNYDQLKYVFSDKVDFYNISDNSLFLQARIFNSYNKIICPIGSALTNLIFCKPNTELLVLLPKSNFTFFHFWQYIADIRKINISYIDGKVYQDIKRFIDPVNCDFYINLNKINDFVI